MLSQRSFCGHEEQVPNFIRWNCAQSSGSAKSVTKIGATIGMLHMIFGLLFSAIAFGKIFVNVNNSNVQDRPRTYMGGMYELILHQPGSE